MAATFHQEPPWSSGRNKSSPLSLGLHVKQFLGLPCVLPGFQSPTHVMKLKEMISKSQ
ncbi:unnamed protein product [Gulo gulo]|uniref:Uncharacterized protein n=1 Tax=Gulo gulo TaxID=48420 RepID=A0A9X9LY91_GULGU|nr:unnamed protein product [Gulo gulo]